MPTAVSAGTADRGARVLAAQAQTAECLVVGEIATQRLLVVLNKVDLLPGAERGKLLARARRRLSQTLAATKFASCPTVAVAARPGDCSSVLSV